MKHDKNTKSVTCCNRRQKILGIIALAGLFACGFAIGWIMNEPRTPDNAPTVLAELPNEPCRIAEELLAGRLNAQNSPNLMEHKSNVLVYRKLISKGCAENIELYKKLLAQEQEIVNLLGGIDTCQQIELSMLPYICNDCGGADDHIENAKVYANLAERGCSENAQQYTDLAKRELEIARAMKDDKMTQKETIEVVETYKRLEMQAAAEEILDKAKKITNPAIDFIIQLEKIINE